jgi:predicted RNA-binding protein YlqC (UPF0109 family)
MTEETRQDQLFIEYIVKAIVDNPDKVRTERTIDERGVLITLYVDPTDMGKVIGKEGRTAKAIRSLLKVLGAKNQARVTMKIVEPEGGRVFDSGSSESMSSQAVDLGDEDL